MHMARELAVVLQTKISLQWHVIYEMSGQVGRYF